jgi:hypothetical protein
MGAAEKRPRWILVEKHGLVTSFFGDALPARCLPWLATIELNAYQPDT